MSKSIRKEYDVFIAYHGSYEQGGSKEAADKLYKYLTDKGIKCFYFPETGRDAYKANIIDVLKSKTFLLVASNNIHKNSDGSIDNNNHLELWTEINTFYAMVQTGLASLANAKIYATGDWYRGDEAKLHELFTDRRHIYDKFDDNPMEAVYKWVVSQIESDNSWSDQQKSGEIQEVLSTKAAVKETLKFDNLFSKAKVIKAVGISNNELTSKANPDSIQACINGGGTIELLFLDPNGKYTSFREEEENKRPGLIKSITQTNLYSALDMKDSLGDKKDSYSIYVYDLTPRMNMIFVDDLLILQYYANNVPGLKNPAFLIKKKDKSPIYDFCTTVYEYIKSKATVYKG